MNYYDTLLARNLANKGDPTIEGLSVTENGSYSETGKAYSPVIVNVPLPSNAYLFESASGNEINITDGAEFPLVNCDVNIDLTQQGSGEPTPTNVRNIASYNEVVITQKDATQNVTNTYTIELNQNVYSGVLNVTTGVLTIDKICKKISDISNWNTQVGNFGRFYATIDTGSDKAYYKADEVSVISDIYKSYTNDNKEAYTNGVYMGGSEAHPQIKIYDTDYTNAEDIDTWKTARANNQLCYKLATPIEVQLTPKQIYLLQNDNILSANSGEIAIQYFGKGVRA